MADIIITEFMDDDAVASLKSKRSVIYDPQLHKTPDTLQRELVSARGLIVRNQTQITAAMLDMAPNLTTIGRLGVGLDNIDLDACRQRGITVIPAIGANAKAVSEYVISVALILLRKAYFSTNDVLSGLWPRTQLIGAEVSGKTLGLIGFGSIARQVSRDATVLGMKTIAFDPFVDDRDEAWEYTEKDTFNNILRRSDILSLHVPLTEGTRHLIGAEALTLMKPSAIIINTSRGGIIDEAALVAALKSDQLSGAALDVFETEPLTAQSGRKFEGLKNLILTPHIAGVTDEANVRISRLIADKILAALA